MTALQILNIVEPNGELLDTDTAIKAMVEYVRHLRNQEHLLCAATWFDDGKKYANQPKNIEGGLVLCGWRHGSIFPQIGGLVKERQELGIFEKEQGFLTSKNRFVGRKEAGEIAFAAGQTDTLIERLHSEDLY